MSNKILIVDDEDHLRMLIEQALEELEDEGVDFLTASNGEEALELIVNEMCRRVKLDLKLNDVSIIILTAKGQELDKKKGEEVGADLYMTKPFDPDKLLEKAREIIGL
jgi:DNA-binding response OmpR family regulator